jgi:hypothetical protein
MCVSPDPLPPLGSWAWTTRCPHPTHSPASPHTTAMTTIPASHSAKHGFKLHTSKRPLPRPQSALKKSEGHLCPSQPHLARLFSFSVCRTLLPVSPRLAPPTCTERQARSSTPGYHGGFQMAGFVGCESVTGAVRAEAWGRGGWLGAQWPFPRHSPLHTPCPPPPTPLPVSALTGRRRRRR